MATIKNFLPRPVHNALCEQYGLFYAMSKFKPKTAQGERLVGTEQRIKLFFKKYWVLASIKEGSGRPLPTMMRLLTEAISISSLGYGDTLRSLRKHLFELNQLLAENVPDFTRDALIEWKVKVDTKLFMILEYKNLVPHNNTLIVPS